MVKYTRPLATDFNVTTKAKLQSLARDIAHFAEQPPVPGKEGELHAYRIGKTTVYPKGIVCWGADMDTGDIRYTIGYLRGEGLEATEITEFPVTATIEGGTITLERPWWAEQHLANINRQIQAKAHLLATVLDLPQEQLTPTLDGGKLIFNWLPEDSGEIEAGAFTQLICGIYAHGATSRKLASENKTSGSQKFAMRCWLIRLGFNGPEYKQLRAILMRNLEGSAAWKTAPQALEGQVSA
ncbi:hypothetical protein ACTOVL_04230 [Arcanobacterium canis]